MWSLGHFTPPHGPSSSMLSLLSLCVTAALLLPLCCGTTTDAQYDEVTQTPDYSDYTFDYDGNSTFSYEMYEILSQAKEADVKAIGSNVNKYNSSANKYEWGCTTKDVKPQRETNLDVQAMYQRMHHFLPS
ncbi:hypothetical protein AOLI_G00047280 [Acnodon oligacanthus]